MDKAAESRTCNFCSNDFSSLDKKFNEQRIKNLPLEERPREKLLQRGVQALTDAELLAILLRTGTARKSARTPHADAPQNWSRFPRKQSLCLL